MTDRAAHRGGGGGLGHFAPGPSLKHEGPLEYLFKRSIYLFIYDYWAVSTAGVPRKK